MRLDNSQAREFFEDQLLQFQIKFHFFDSKVQISPY
jgi:hypothetical protein